MAQKDRGTRFDEEIAEIENRRGDRNLFLGLGGAVLAILLVVVVLGARERMRLAEEASRPLFEPVELGGLVGVAGNVAVFARGQSLYYVQDIGGAEFTSDTDFVRRIEYDPLGQPDTIPPGTTYWSLVESDTLPYVVERVANPLTGVNPAQYQAMAVGSLRPEDYGAGGPKDWRLLELEETRVQVTGRASREADNVFLVADSVRVQLRLSSISAIDSLEVAWATENEARLTAYGQITESPRATRRGEIPTLFVLLVNTVHPPPPAEAEAAADTTAAAGDTVAPAADTAAPATP